MFKIKEHFKYTNTNIRGIESGIKPQDFNNIGYDKERHGRRISPGLLEKENVRTTYLLWYHLIAARAVVKASDMGFNYVFSTSRQQKSAELPYCSVLARAFRLTVPRYIHEYENIQTCERKLVKIKEFDFIGSR